MNYSLDIIMLPVQWIVIFFTAYYIVLAIFGTWHPKEKKILIPKNKFAMVIPAP